jgi:16S rRNA (cytosine1402-N4)-methyltransferase
MYHQPVLLQQCIEGLNIKPDGIYVDVTFGGGGHSKEILRQLGEKGKLFAFDQDADAAKNVPDDKRLTFIPQNFMFMRNFLKMHGVIEVDGILADLGVSSHQFDVAERGFSIRFDAHLDMRMNQLAELTAAKVLNEYDEKKLYRIFREYGDVENTGKLVKTIVEKRGEKLFDTINEFKQAISSCIPKHAESKYLAKVFQALRIEVNNEEDVLKNFLAQSQDLLKEGGRLVVMSYHSLEDRLVKNFIKTGNMEGTVNKDFFGNIHRPFELITRKPVVPHQAEIESNSRARSAKLRIAEKARYGKPV